MNAVVSRRFASVMNAYPFSGMTPEERLRMAAVLEAVSSITEVPEPFRGMLRRAEKAREQLGAAR